MDELEKFISDQLSVWPLASANFRSMKHAQTRTLDVCGLECTVQHNPERVASTTARTDSAYLKERACFLCAENRPPEQFHLKLEGRKGRNYNIQVNPYPIFPNHLVIVRDSHIPQTIWHHFPDMLSFVDTHRDYMAFYNGPLSGASAPDHLHFQACPRHLMPLEEAVDSFLDNPGAPLSSVKDARLFLYRGFVRGVFALKARTPKSLAKMFYRLLDCTDRQPGETEPKFNLFCYVKGEEYRAFVVMRSQSRSHHYHSTGSDHLTMSPGAADVAGFFIAPIAEDFAKLRSEDLAEMLSEVCISAQEEDMTVWRLTREEPLVEVGIMSAKEIVFEIISDGAGPQKVSWCDGRISYNGLIYDELYFDSITRSTLFDEASFILHDVVIGIDFHWQRKRTLRYAGGLKFIVEGDRITAVNRIGAENYLLSVISSEMKSSASEELLKAHAVISRSWLYARMAERKAWLSGVGAVRPPHGNYDVCADDHCQRYQGFSMVTGENVRAAIDRTWGRVLRYGGELCDARYSKCCGGVTEIFSTCWEDRDYAYLQSFRDRIAEDRDFCDCSDKKVLSQVLNDYDMETADFYEWTVRYTQEELSALVRKRTGEDFGLIEELEPIERGPSGRIKYLRIKGSAKTETIGKELKIRRALSESHLKSSAFEVLRDGSGFVLRGRGWGHGVGLCQIGAAVMAEKGYTYEDILKHYYRGAEIG